jgi:hypothetical protein
MSAPIGTSDDLTAITKLVLELEEKTLALSEQILNLQQRFRLYSYIVYPIYSSHLIERAAKVIYWGDRNRFGHWLPPEDIALLDSLVYEISRTKTSPDKEAMRLFRAINVDGVELTSADADGNVVLAAKSATRMIRYRTLPLFPDLKPIDISHIQDVPEGFLSRFNHDVGLSFESVPLFAERAPCVDFTLCEWEELPLSHNDTGSIGGVHRSPRSRGG